MFLANVLEAAHQNYEMKILDFYLKPIREEHFDPS